MTYVAGGRQYVVIAAGGHDRMHTTMGDYVMAFALPGKEGSVSELGAAPRDGAWSGEMRVGDARFTMALTIRSAASNPTATVRMDSVQLSGPVTATRTGRAIRIEFPFRYPPKNNCTATVSMNLELWNDGKLLEGAGTVDGQCADHGHQDAAFVFQPAK
jgi:hypothetical protein